MVIRDGEPTAHQLRLFLTLSAELHFGAAAAKLHLTQPALSQQIRTLEQRLGVPLFERSSRRVDLTPAGKQLLPLARDIVESSDRLHVAADRLADEDQRLKLGVCESFGSLPATRALIAAVAKHDPALGPDIEVIDIFTDQLAAVRDGRIDAAFLHLPVPDDLHAHPLHAEPIDACVATANPLASRTKITLTDLADYPVISLTPQDLPDVRKYWAADPRPAGSPVQYTNHQLTRFESLLSTIAHTPNAVAFVPASAAELYPRSDLTYLRVDGMHECLFGLAWRKNPPDQRKVVVLEQVTKKYWNSHEPQRPAAR